MTRSLTTALKNRLIASPTTPCYLWTGTFNAVPLYLWSGYGDLSWDSKTWIGNGWLQGFAGGSEQTDVSAQEMVVTLAGVPQDILSLVLNANQGATGKFYIGALDTAGAIVVDPYLIFSGKLDVPKIKDDVENPVITISYESKFVDLDRPREFRYSSESQKIFYPGDRGFEYSSSAATWNGTWSNKKVDIRKKKPIAKAKRK